MFRAAFRRRRTWLAPVLALACAATVLTWLVADETRERLAMLLLAAAGIAVFVRLTHALTRGNERLTALAQIVETTGDAIVAARLDRTITAWNSGAEELFGYTAEEMIGGSVARIVPPDDHHSLQANLDEMLAKGKHSYEVKRLRKDGTLIDVQITLSPLRDETGHVVGISSILRDISDRMKLEAHRDELLAREREARTDAEYARALVEEQNRHLVELDRMKDDFVASVSHELRTPLTSISGYLDLMLEEEEEDLPPAQRQYLSVVQRNAERLLRLVGDLLFVAQVDAGRISLEMSAVDLSALIADSVEVVRPIAEEKHIRVLTDVESIEMARADALRLGQVLDNILSNAVKFTPEEGCVTVHASLADDVALVQVTDTGMGIAPEDQARLFDRFFRTAAANHMAIPGTGLGLAIAKAIVEGHDGAISIASEPGKGTTVRLELPVHGARSETPRYVETLL